MSEALLASLARPLLCPAMLVRLDRRDGVTLGFSTCDRAISRDGLRYRANPGMSVSAITARSTSDDDGISISGPAAATQIDEQDIAESRWDDATLAVQLIDWAEPSLGVLPLFLGQVTSLSIEGGAGGLVVMEAQRLLALAMRQGPMRTTPMCRAQLGDGRCGVDMSERTQVAEILAIDGDRVSVTPALASPALFNHGMARALTGLASGLDMPIVAVDGDGMRWGWVPRGLKSGDRVRLREGCDKRFSTCVGRFCNAAGFDAEPHLPGQDALVRYGAP